MLLKTASPAEISFQELFDRYHQASKKEEDFTAHSAFLFDLIEALRPPRRQSPVWSQMRFEQFLAFLKRHPSECTQLSTSIQALFTEKDFTLLFADSGVALKSSFISELTNRIGESILPPLYRDNEMSDFIEAIFYKPIDYHWVNEIGSDLWMEFWQLMQFDERKGDQLPRFLNEALYNAIVILANRLSALGLEPEILDRLPNLKLRGSAFMALNTEVGNFVEIALTLFRSKNSPEGPELSKEEKTELTIQVKVQYQRVLESIDTCVDRLEEVHRNQQVFGVSQSLVYLLYRGRKLIDRLKLLLAILDPDDFDRADDALKLFYELIRSINQKRVLGEHFTENTSLLAYTIAEHTSKSGENYITTTSKEYWQFLKDAMGGGFLVSFTNWIKVLISYVNAAPLVEAAMYSINYAGTFITMHILHFSLATKQPALTASSLAKALDKVADSKNDYQYEEERLNLNEAAEIITRISRSQFAAFVGNLGVVFPLAFILSWCWLLVSGEHIATEEKALKIIDSFHPFHSFSLIYACVTGVALYVSSLISGYYDNRVLYAQIHRRIEQHRLLKRLFSERTRKKISRYIEFNLGALSGNFFLGIILGTLPIVGKISGLPLDIRHVTIASGGFSIALASLWGPELLTPKFLTYMPFNEYVIVFMGILGIGLLNFLVSFGLSLSLAMSSRRANFRQARALSVIVLKRFILNPAPFIFPPKRDEEKSVSHKPKTESHQ